MTKAPPPRTTVAEHFRREIERAEADGALRADMLLKLTLSDAHKIKRDPALALTDVGFADGVMRFLGVKVEQGGNTTSSLTLPAA